jgi:phosphatidylglycerophosphate synthase
VISSRIGHSLDPVVLKVYKFLFVNRQISPNTLTVVGFIAGVASAVLVAMGRPVLAGALLLVAGLFDLMDGAVARTNGRVTPYGGFLDSVLDRYTDLFVALGISIYFLREGDTLFSAVTFFAAIGIAVIPYAKARAEAAGVSCDSGLLERPERTMLLIIGLLSGLIQPVIVILAVLTHVTVIQRMVHVWGKMKNKEGE